MNISEIRRAIRTSWGECQGCGEPDFCVSCRVVRWAELAWDAGQRSGAAQSRETSVRVEWVDWPWGDVRPELLQYVESLGQGSLFQTPGFTAAILDDSMERAGLWATSKGAKRKDWTAFLKLWIRRELSANGGSGLRQGQSTLGHSTSSGDSRQTAKQSKRSEQARRLLDR